VSFEEVIQSSGGSSNSLFRAEHNPESNGENEMYGSFNITIEDCEVKYNSEGNVDKPFCIYINSSNVKSVLNISKLIVNRLDMSGIFENGSTLYFIGSASRIDITESIFNSSKSTVKGGVIYFNILDEPRINISKCIFSNSSSEIGGAIYSNVVFNISYSDSR
jgi:predicted outer membrane repeat protein